MVSANARDVDRADVRERLLARGLMLDVLRRVFLAEPEREFLKVCSGLDIALVFPFLGQSEEGRKGLQDVAAYFEAHDPVDSEDDYDALHWDYTRLFVGPHAPLAPIWASYYLEPEKLLFQQTTLSVRNLYRSHGLLRDGAMTGEADDHLGLELDFLCKMNQRMVQVIENGGADDALTCADQSAFVENHLSAFVPEFRKLVAAHAATSFYVGFAGVLAGFVEEDARFLGEIERVRQASTREE